MRCMQGFTLIDLLTALSIMALLLGLSSQLYTHFIADYRATAAINRLLGAVNYARFQAISRGQTITLCPRGPQNHCSRTWTAGIVIFADNNNNGQRDSGEALLQVLSAFRQGKLTWSGFGSRFHVRFNNLGMTIQQNGSFIYCAAQTKARYARILIINKSGRPRLGKDSNHNRIVENAQGKDIVC